MSSVLRRVVVGASLSSLAACATAPSRTSAPAPVRNELYLCPKIFVANAPPSDAYGRILSYEPFIVMRGVALRRAPVEACLSSAYGVRTGGAGVVHDGLDLYTGSPRAVAAAAGGRVVWIRDQRGYGLTVAIDHGFGVETRYAHLSSAVVGENERVRAGETIAMTGRSGNATAVHLHYEIRLDGQPQDPLLFGIRISRRS